MTKEEYIKIVNEKLEGNSKDIMLAQIENYYDAKEYELPKHSYKVGDDVYLKKGTLLHGTYKNIEGLKEILKDGLISNWFIEGRNAKYPSSVGVWNLKQDYLLKDYIDFYSGGTIKFQNMDNSGIYKTEVIPLSELSKIDKKILNSGFHRWDMEQTKESRFMPNLVQGGVQVGIIFNGDNEYVHKLLEGDILNEQINDEDVKPFVNEWYYDRFIIDRKNKDDFFTDRESAILFGVPANLIEGILVGRKYEKAILDGSADEIIEEIKAVLPNVYICNLDGKVIKE